MAILIALAFIQTTLLVGLPIFITLVAAGLWIRSWLSHMNLLLVARISDNGPGIPAADREQIFEALYSTKSFGVGLGLAITRQIMEDHGGELSLDDRPEGGAIVRMVFPLSDTVDHSQPAADARSTG